MPAVFLLQDAARDGFGVTIEPKRAGPARFTLRGDTRDVIDRRTEAALHVFGGGIALEWITRRKKKTGAQ